MLQLAPEEGLEPPTWWLTATRPDPSGLPEIVLFSFKKRAEFIHNIFPVKLTIPFLQLKSYL